MRRRWMVGAFAPGGQQTGDTGRRFFTRAGALREQRRYNVERGVLVPTIVDGKPDWSRMQRLVTYVAVEVAR